ncbi:VOC family protein [Nocardioides dongkuii]|uniref:VOC family protein n=1 Tax=Nocardioides dongkuii TaxID=2760089 RepID=UPI001877EA0F|nr:VOC family protein [Nocardioides dongkuii]
MTPTWITAFLDLAPADHPRALDFWQRVTGHALSPTRGEHDEFVSLVPPDGDVQVKIQRLGSGPTRVHLDLHVAAIAPVVEHAVGVGATLVADHGYAVLASPGGFPFCLVTHPASVRATPATWPGGHRSALDQVCLDVPPDLWDAEVAFWSSVTGWPTRSGGPDFVSLVRPPHVPVRILLQRLEDPQPSVTGHLDRSATARPAETARHVALGAEVLAVHEWWTVLRPPAGPPYCITDRDPETGVLP